MAEPGSEDSTGAKHGAELDSEPERNESQEEGEGRGRMLRFEIWWRRV